MKNLFKKFLALLMSVLMTASCVALPTNAFAQVKSKYSPISDSVPYVKGEAVAVLNSDISSKTLKNVSKNFGNGLSLVKSFDFSNDDSVNRKNNSDSVGNLKIATFKSDSLTTEQIIKKLANNNNVEYVSPNYIYSVSDITDDEYSKYQWALDNNGQNNGTIGSDINAESLWENASQSDDDKIVAVLDTGIDYTSDEFENSLWVNPYGSKLIGKYGYDFTNTNADGSPLDDNGHGSHVAGIIAAQGDNQKGISGVNKDGVKIMSLKWLDEYGEGMLDNVIAAYEYVYRAMSLGANVVAVNNSWGGYGDEATKIIFDLLFDTVGEMGAVSFVAAGNDGIDFINNEEFNEFYDDEYLSIPASSDSEYSLVVAASNENDGLASFSSYNKEYTDIAAPGTDILSTVSYNCFNPTVYSDSQISELCGTYEDFDDVSSTFVNTTSENFTSLDDDFNEDTSFFSQIKGGSIGKYFGTSGSALTFSIDKDSSNKTVRYFAYAIPFTLDSASDNYSISLMVNSTDNVSLVGCDAPADSTFSEAFNDGTEIFFQGSYGDDYWNHYVYNIAPDDEPFYEKNTSRKLFLLIAVDNNAGNVSIDDFAVSKQGVSSDKFGKYDFYNGTSMATPYAAGAYALIKNAYPSATTAQALNILKNTGRYTEKLDGKTVNSKVLSLDKTTQTPPMIMTAQYNADGNLSIKGDFTADTTITVNNSAVDAISTDKNEIIIPDNKYSTKIVSISVSNEYGSDTKDILVSNKKLLQENKDMLVPMFEEDAYFMPVGTESYVMDTDGLIGFISEDYENEGVASYDSYAQSVDFSKLSEEDALHTIIGATYLNNKIYFVDKVTAITSTYVNLGYDLLFGTYDLESDETTLLCELPYDEAGNYMASIEGFSLATYNGEIYIIGGYNNATRQYSNKVYKYSVADKKFVDTGADLPESRAYGKTIQFKSTLVYAYGTNSTEKMPSILTFNGSSWSKSAIDFNSDDYQTVTFGDNSKAKVYNGNLAIGNNNVTCLGSYVYGYGDLYAYSVEKDKLLSYGYNLRADKSGNAKSYVTSIYGILVVYSMETDADGYPTLKGYQKSIDTTFADFSFEYSETAGISVDKFVAMYGDVVNVYVSVESGYAVDYLEVNGKKYSANGKAGDIVFPVVVNSDCLDMYAAGKYVAPNKVTGLKVSATSGSSFTLSWKKPSRAAGYQIQEYKNKKWTTVKTVTSANTLSAKLTPGAGTHKYRVRAYSVYDGKKYYGAASSTVSVYIPKQQTISSVTAGKKSFTIKFNKDTSASGYQVKYSTNSKFSPATTKAVTSNKTSSYTAKSLKGKKYYIRVRSYKTINGKNVYGAWSTTKTITVK